MSRRSEHALAEIKHRIDIVALIGEYLTVNRSGSKYKALCPFHDDHNPSMEINPDRQSFKCWVCGAGGDVFDFVKDYERVTFPEALRMLAEKAGVVLDDPAAGPAVSGPSKTELFAVNAWAEQAFADALARSEEARLYLAKRRLSAAEIERFRLGFSPMTRDWLVNLAKREGFGLTLLEQAGLIVRSSEGGLPHERFRGRLIFPIHDLRGRTVGFGGRILPELEKKAAEAGRGVAKYLNTPETILFQKRRNLYGADLARTAARDAGWVAVVEGYTDVIAAHQVGLTNVVGTLGTALRDDHVTSLRRLSDKVVLVFDGDAAGQSAADRSLEFFLSHEIDLRVLTLPAGLDPCDFLLEHGAEAFRGLVEESSDALEFAIDRAGVLFDLESAEGSRRAGEWILSILGKIPRSHRVGLDLKVAKALDRLEQRTGIPASTLARSLESIRARSSRGIPRSSEGSEASGDVAARPAAPIVTTGLDPIDLELVRILLNEPSLVGRLITRVAVPALADAPLRAILSTCYDLHGEGRIPTFEHVSNRLGDAAVRAFAAGLLLPLDPSARSTRVQAAAWEVRLEGALAAHAERERKARLRELESALRETQQDPAASPEDRRLLLEEYLRLTTNRPGSKAKTAS
ncbi:MAG: DNA primase [Isosphaeraceae bacterium]|nr:DNA primase [Isosphaeraceae bacterium]